MKRIRGTVRVSAIILIGLAVAAGIGAGLAGLLAPAQAATPLNAAQDALAYTTLTAGTFAKISTASATVPTITVCSAATDQVIGVIETAATAGKVVRYAPLGTVTNVTAGEAISAGALVVAGTSGRAYNYAAGTATNQIIAGRAMTAASTGGDSIQIVLFGGLVEARKITTAQTLTAVTGATSPNANASGKVYNVTATATITLPATAAGVTYTFVNGGADGTVQITLSPNASDKISGMGTTGTDNKDLINTLSTAKKGDFVVLIGDGGDGWQIAAQGGPWAWETP